jgi:DNA replication protein DnaC
MRVEKVLCEVNKVEDIVSGLMRTTEEPGDYTGDDGLLYCGKCHTPKQTRLSFNPLTGERSETIVRAACQCQREADEEAEKQSARTQFRLDMARRREDGLSCPDGLRYTFAQDDRQQPKVSDACKRYVECWDEMRANNIGVLFYGSVGTGKSFLASCIGNGLLDRQVSVAATNFPRLLNLLQDTYEKQALLDRLSIYKLLIVDDLGVERDSAYAEEQIFNIIDARSSSELPVIVTTNLTLEELERPTSMQYARIYDRVLEMCPIRLKLAGESRRKANASEREQLARKILLG